MSDVLLTIDGMTFTTEGDGQPRIRDIDAAIRAGWKRPRAIRDLIKRLRKRGLLPSIHCRHAVRRQLTGQGGHRSFVVEEFWLTESELLIVMTQSGTKYGDEILKKLVAVFQLVKQGRLPIAAPPVLTLPPSLAADIQVIKANSIDMIECVERHPSHLGLVSGSRYEGIVYSAIDTAAERTGQRFSKVHGILRTMVKGLAGYKFLPICMVPDITQFLRQLKAEHPRLSRAQKQLSLWPMDV